MFNNRKNDSLVDSVKAVMEQNELHRRVEAAVNEHFGVTSRKALPHEMWAEYDAVLAEAKKCAMEEQKPLSPKQKAIMDVNKNNKIDAHDLELKRAGLEEESEQVDEAMMAKIAKVVDDLRHAKSDAADREKIRKMDKGKPYKLVKKAKMDKRQTKYPIRAGRSVPVVNEEHLEEKAKSEQQQKFFGLVRAIQKGKAHGSAKAEKAAKEMSVKSVRDYAKTKHEGLPKKVDEESVFEEIRNNLEEQLIAVFESGDEDAFNDFISSLTEEQIDILGLMERTEEMSGRNFGAENQAARRPGVEKSGGPSSTSANVPAKDIWGKSMPAPKGTGADPEAAKGPSSIPSGYDPNVVRQRGSMGQAATPTTKAPSATAPDLSGGRQSATTGASVDKPGAQYKPDVSGALKPELPKGARMTGKPATRVTPASPVSAPTSAETRYPGAYKSDTRPAATPAARSRQPGSAPSAVRRPSGVARPGATNRPMRAKKPGATNRPMRAKKPGAQNLSTQQITSRALGGAFGEETETPIQVKESFEQFLRNKFLKG